MYLEILKQLLNIYNRFSIMSSLRYNNNSFTNHQQETNCSIQSLNDRTQLSDRYVFTKLWKLILNRREIRRDSTTGFETIYPGFVSGTVSQKSLHED